jgi:hypothetical protein
VPQYITRHDGEESFVNAVQDIVGYAVDVKKRDGTAVSTVVVAVSSSGLTLDRWDEALQGPACDPFGLDLEEVLELVIH